MTTEQTLYTEKHPEKKEPWLPTPDWRTDDEESHCHRF